MSPLPAVQPKDGEQHQGKCAQQVEREGCTHLDQPSVRVPCRPQEQNGQRKQRREGCRPRAWNGGLMELWTFQALPMACLTGLRREDVISLLWSRVSDIAIEKPTLKSKGRKVAVVPLLKDTVGLLTEIKAQQISRHRQLVENAKRKVGRRPPPASRYSRTPADARGPSMGRSTR